jgi:hypothetical protein
LEHVGFFRPDLTYAADMTMWLMYAVHADVGLLDADQGYYRIHPENMSVVLANNPLLRNVRRKGAIDALLEHAGHRLPDPALLRNKAYRVIGLDALDLASRAFDAGDSARCREAIEFAVACWPDVVHQKAYHWLRIKIRIGPSGSNLLRRLSFRPRLATAAPDASVRTPALYPFDQVRDFEKAIGELHRPAR